MLSSVSAKMLAENRVPRVSILRPGRPPRLFTFCALLFALLAPAALSAQAHFDGAKALEYARQFAAIGPRWPTGPGHTQAEQFLRSHFAAAHDAVEEDAFTANTPIGPVPLRNFIVRYQGSKPGVIVLASHYETNYPLKGINYVGANDGAATTGLLMAIGDRLHEQTAHGRKLEGYSVWLVFFDGEEAIECLQCWSHSDSTYGSRHLAAKWDRDGTLRQIKAFLLADMIGDKDLNVQRETNSTGWLLDLVAQAAKRFGYERYFFQKQMPIEDDHLPFVERKVPCVDVIDLEYGPPTADHPEGSYHHTAQDTMDKISAKSLTIDGDVFLETIRLVNQR
jgi:Zn-dependent M28 family amino/carboxypeptidase